MKYVLKQTFDAHIFTSNNLAPPKDGDTSNKMEGVPDWLNDEEWIVWLDDAWHVIDESNTSVKINLGDVCIENNLIGYDALGQKADNGESMPYLMLFTSERFNALFSPENT